VLNLLPLVCFVPLAAALILTVGGRRMPEPLAAVLGVGSIGLAALLAAMVGVAFFTSPLQGGAITYPLWTWMQVGNYAPVFALRLDALSLIMLGVITGVGFCIHLFAVWYMRGDAGFARFFAYMNAFVASMLFLVLADDLMFLYLGWEGVGLFSYLLIGFWFRDPANGLAARKAFIVTRIGDTALLLGLLLLYREFGTLDIQSVLELASQAWTVGNPTATLACLLILGGAVGKSAQLPLQTWLPDAMAGPTPVSALIHAATMVTAGVYLVVRLHPLYELSPVALASVGIIGAATLLLAGFAALVQTDIKRILAYSTMSQIGYMFLAAGVGAYESAMFHLMTHAFFKALLFLSAGSVILALHHEQDIFRMGGLSRRMPWVFACMLVGTLALTAFPFTSGFFSKEAILHHAYASGHLGLWWAGVFGALLTALYSFRLIFVVFFGAPRTNAAGESSTPAGAPFSHQLPLGILFVLALVGGFIHLPPGDVLPAHVDVDIGFAARLPVIVSLAGIALAWLLFVRLPQIPAALATQRATAWLGHWWRSAWGFDWLYDRVLVRPFVWLTRVNRDDVVDPLIGFVAVGANQVGALVAVTQNGRMRYYAAVAGLGVCALIAILALQ